MGGVGEVSGVKQEETSSASTCDTFITVTKKQAHHSNIPLCSLLSGSAEASASLRHHGKNLTELMCEAPLRFSSPAFLASHKN